MATVSKKSFKARDFVLSVDISLSGEYGMFLDFYGSSEARVDDRSNSESIRHFSIGAMAFANELEAAAKWVRNRAENAIEESKKIRKEKN